MRNLYRLPVTAAGFLAATCSWLPLNAYGDIAFEPLKDAIRSKYDGKVVLPSDRKFDSNCKKIPSGIIRCSAAYTNNMLRHGELVPLVAVREEDRKLGVYFYIVFALNCKSKAVLYRYVDGRKLDSATRGFRAIDFNSPLTKKLGSSWKLADSWSPSPKEVQEKCQSW